MGAYLGCILRIELVRCIGGLKVKYERKKEIKGDFKVLTQAIKRMELPLTEVGGLEEEHVGRGEY